MGASSAETGVPQKIAVAARKLRTCPNRDRRTDVRWRPRGLFCLLMLRTAGLIRLESGA